jgi:lysozyme family protein
LQQALNVGVDGVIGDQTTSALAGKDQAAVARQVLALRFRGIADIVASDSSQIIFLRGWVNRAATLLGML